MIIKHYLLPLLVVGAITPTIMASSRCVASNEVSEELEKECSSTEYSTYVDCIRRRSKRHTDCMSGGCDDGGDCDGGGGGNDCGQCDCNYCSYNDCEDNCSSCCQSYTPPCQTRTCCHATCQSSCRTSHCRRTCRTRCNKSVAGRTEVIVTGGGGSGSGSNTASGSTSSKTDNKVNVANQAKHNITTVINLKTVVNNTNIVDMPVTLNNTNVNNITMHAAEPGEINVNVAGRTDVIQPPYPTPQPPPPPPPGTCCNLISPRQCVPTHEPPFAQCYHTKSRVCGDVCQSATMHAEPHRVCENAVQPTGAMHTQCHEQVAYIPQPQPKCYSTSQWPYVSCAVAQPSCGGCYTHMVQGGGQTPPPPPPPDCPNSCYDQGINVGPYYRQGPYYQPQANQLPQAVWNSNAGGFPNMGGGGFPTAMNPAMMPGNVEGTAFLESIGPTFNSGPNNVHLMMPENETFTDHNNAFFRNRRHGKDDDTKENEHVDETMDYRIEEIPIKMD